MYKKLLLSFGLVVMILVSFGCANKNAEAKADTKTVAKGMVMHIELPANPTTGFAWEYSVDESEAAGILDEVMEDYQSDAVDEGVVGAGGTTIYEFEASKEGPQKITFTYRRPWDGGETAYDVVYELDIDEDYCISYIKKSKGVVESDKDLSFFPDPTFYD